MHKHTQTHAYTQVADVAGLLSEERDRTVREAARALRCGLRLLAAGEGLGVPVPEDRREGEGGVCVAMSYHEADVAVVERIRWSLTSVGHSTAACDDVVEAGDLEGACSSLAAASHLLVCLSPRFHTSARGHLMVRVDVCVCVCVCVFVCLCVCVCVYI